MPASAPQVGQKAKSLLRKLGDRIRKHRKGLGVSAAATAESAGMSRVTLFRIEKGEPSVTIGAYLNVIMALGLSLEINERNAKPKNRLRHDCPKKILLDKYQQLKRLAWQRKDAKEISPKEALELYERNWRFIDPAKMESEERELIQQLLSAFGRERLLV